MRLSIAVIGLVTVTGLTPQAALAVPATNPSQLVNNDIEDGCLSANFSNDVYITTCSGSIYHQWKREKDTPNAATWVLRNVGTGRCLSSNNNGAVYTVDCPLNDSFLYHRWSAIGNNSVQITNRGNAQCMSASSVTEDVYMTGGTFSCSDIPAHSWLVS